MNQFDGAPYRLSILTELNTTRQLLGCVCTVRSPSVNTQSEVTVAIAGEMSRTRESRAYMENGGGVR